MSETMEADGKWLNVGCKFSKDRFLPVGPAASENEQLIDITGEKWCLVADHYPVRPEPHDFIIIKRDKIKTRQIYDFKDFPNSLQKVEDSRVERNGNKVTIYLRRRMRLHSICAK